MSATSAILRKCAYQSRNTGRILKSQSAFKLLFVLCFALGLEAGLWALFVDGLAFLERLGGVGGIIISRLFGLLFMALGVMLVVSGIVTSYSTVFRSPEMPFLVVRPFRLSDIVTYKFLESAALASWAFFFIIIPFIGAYAWHERLSPWVACWALVFSIPFLLLCSGLGTFITLVAVRWCPRGRRVRQAGILLAAAAAIYLWHASHGVVRPADEFRLDLRRLVPGLSLAAHPLLPSFWVSDGIMSLARGQWFRGAMLWGVTLSTALLIYTIVDAVGTRVFFDAWQRAIGSRGGERRAPVLLPALDRLPAPIPRDVRAMLTKDVRLFLRDPMQWSQVLIFFGLLGLYFANLRSFRYHTYPESWRNIVAFLNVFSVASIMCSLGSRFVYPQLSLEGQGFWMLGLSPTTMTRILGVKFAASLIGMTLVSVVLMLLSSGMLNAAPIVRVVAVALVVAISMAVSALSTGLGAIFLDLSQRNPAAIVSGFGGTLNLVLSLIFMMAAILPFGLVFHLNITHAFRPAELSLGLLLAGGWLVLLTAAATCVPLWLGNRSLRRREF